VPKEILPALRQAAVAGQAGGCGSDQASLLARLVRYSPESAAARWTGPEEENSGEIRGSKVRTLVRPPTRGGFSTKIHLRTNANGAPLTFGEAHEVKGYEALIELHDVDPGRLRSDKRYHSDAIRADLTKRGIDP
jgi:hypothetical protein